MNFVYEKISEEDKQRVDFEAIYGETGYIKQMTPSKWTIDRISGAFMIGVVIDREPPHIEEYALIWKGEVFRLFFEYVETPSKIEGKLVLTEILIDIKYRYGFDVPLDLKQEVINLALDAICVRNKTAFSRSSIYLEFRAISKIECQ